MRYRWLDLWMSESRLVTGDGEIIAALQLYEDGWRAFLIDPKRKEPRVEILRRASAEQAHRFTLKFVVDIRNTTG